VIELGPRRVDEVVEGRTRGIRSVELRLYDLGAGEVGLPQAGAPQPSPSEVGVAQRHPVEARPVELSCLQLHPLEDRASQVQVRGFESRRHDPALVVRHVLLQHLSSTRVVGKPHRCPPRFKPSAPGNPASRRRSVGAA
jgi:hypothetical protein